MSLPFLRINPFLTSPVLESPAVDACVPTAPVVNIPSEEAAGLHPATLGANQRPHSVVAPPSMPVAWFTQPVPRLEVSSPPTAALREFKHHASAVNHTRGAC